MESSELITRAVTLFFSIIVAWIIYLHYRNRITYSSERYSTFAPRFWAPFIDGVVLWPVTGMIPILVVYFLPSTSIYVESFTFLISYAYSIYFHGKYGATIGKLKCKILVVDARTEKPIGYLQAFKRDVVPLVLILLIIILHPIQSNGGQKWLELIPIIFLLWLSAEILTMLTNKKRRALHDYIAGTVVIRPLTHWTTRRD